MSEPEIQKVLHAYASSSAAPDQFARIQKEVRRRKTSRSRVRAAAAALLLCFTFLTFAPAGGSALGAIRKEIQPTLFLKTTVGEAKRTVREPLQLPATYPYYTGENLPLTDDAPALVGRWLSYETVAVTVTSEPDGVGVIGFDLRRSTYRPEPGEDPWGVSPNRPSQSVKVGEYDGVAFLHNDGQSGTIVWATETHVYRLMTGRFMPAEELALYASQIR